MTGRDRDRAAIGKVGRGRIAGVVLGTIAAACSPLRTFDALVPKDGGVRMVVRGAAFGTDPRHRLDIYAPRRGTATLPVIVFLYGGSWNSGTRTGYGFVGRALAARPKVLMVDEMSLGLAPIIVERLLPVLRRIADTGVGILMVEQHVQMSLEVADQAYVLSHGELVLSGTAAEMSRHRELLEMSYLGEQATGP